MESTIEEWLLKKYEGLVCRIIREPKEDLNLSTIFSVTADYTPNFMSEMT